MAMEKLKKDSSKGLLTYTARCNRALINKIGVGMLTTLIGRMTSSGCKGWST